MAATVYLNIDGIKGESTAEKFAGQIECQTVSFDDSVSVLSSIGGGGSSGKVSFSPVVFTKIVDTASPQILVALAGGKHFSAATISFVRGGEGFAFVTLTLKQVFFTAQNVNLSSGGTMEAVKLNFATLQLSVASQKPDGSLNPPVQGGWDLLQNKPL